MADLVFPVSTFITAYSSSGSVSWWAASVPQPFETIFRETTSANSIFDTTETLEVLEGGVSKGNATYAGTVTHLGVEYPAFNMPNGQLLVYGVSLTQPDYPDIASLNLDTSEYPFCFLAGTAIATPDGPVAVERLCIGDLVLTFDGHWVPVKWIG
uniref:Hint domain-containing protein n=1 Tax=Nioella sediminis TaxID=1912092 RepID=UPI000B1AE391